ncbi:hypothetical protein HCG46_21490 [Labrenzia sp. PO1]|uniref:hypothetical protein n=1 Tax=Labrenzia sp. PO1 TaxID=2720390 RepID=UPI0014468092|nr:hypothetical protein [Labrenzia sp. PO1]MCR9283680.1 hypothetical protein [Paracoccaceae bacterium]NKI60857.1 hypothetical protein [Labrenzia sp. PO1]
MSDTDKKPDQEKGDEIPKRMLNAPPDPKTKEKDADRSQRPPVSKEGLDNRSDAE